MRRFAPSLVVGLLSFAGLCVPACGGSSTDGDSSDAGAQCTVGDTRVCVGPGACSGGQICISGGTWSACDCGTGVGGSAGVGGAGGSGGSSGSGTGGILDCSLSVEKAGKLPDPVSLTARLTGPAIAATDDGFVLAYRDQDGDTLRAVLLFVSDAGAEGAPSVLDLAGCASKEPTDGVGIAFENGAGMVASSLPDCGAGAGAVFIPFDSKGVIGNASGPRNATFLDLTVAQQGSLAPAAKTGEWELLYRVVTASSAVVERVVLQGPSFKSIPIVHPFGDVDIPFGMVATSPNVRAYLAPFANGADGGAPTMRVFVGDRQSDTINTAGTFEVPLASWATMTAWDNHVAAAVPASAGTALTVADLAGNAVNVSATGLVGSGPTESAALAALRDHFFVAQGYPGSILVERLAGAKSKVDVKPVDTVPLPTTFGGVSLTDFSGAQMAMAAARDHVAVVWLNKPQLSSGDATGGWALLRCSI